MPAIQSLAESAISLVLFQQHWSDGFNRRGLPLLSVLLTSSFEAFPNATMSDNKRGSPLAGPKASTLSKCTPILVMLPPLFLSVALIALQSRVMLGSWRVYINENLSAISAAKQILAGVMGALQVSAVLAILFNFPARTRLAHPTSGSRLDTLGLMSALSVPRMDWNLPKSRWLFVFIAIGFAHGPAALWASAITPLPTTRSLPRGSMMLPGFSEASKDLWDQFTSAHYFSMENCTVQSQTSSSVTNCPIPYRQNALLNTAREATAPKISEPRIHSKLDSPAWTYYGRSYGAGSSVGLQLNSSTTTTSDIPENFQLNNYSFEETGYNASVQCHYDSQSNLTFKYKINQEDVGLFRLQGTLPGMNETVFDPVIAGCGRLTHEQKCENPNRAPMFAWFANNEQQQYEVGIKATSWYKDDFDNITCSLEFVPTVFTVAVNVTSKSINVTAGDTNIADPDPTQILKKNTVLSLKFLSTMSLSLYVSVLGDAFSANLNTTKQVFPDMARHDAALRATQDSFEAILDDILGVYGSSQISIQNDTTTKGIQGSFDSYRIGKPLVHIFTLVLNLLIVLGILIEVFRTRFWRDLPKYDMMDFKSTVTAASFGGKDISRKIQAQSPEKWAADPGDRKLGEIEVCLRQGKTDEPMIIPYHNSSLLQDEANGDDMEMDERTAPFESDPYEGAASVWSPIGQPEE